MESMAEQCSQTLLGTPSQQQVASKRLQFLADKIPNKMSGVKNTIT